MGIHVKNSFGKEREGTVPAVSAVPELYKLLSLIYTPGSYVVIRLSFSMYRVLLTVAVPTFPDAMPAVFCSKKSLNKHYSCNCF